MPVPSAPADARELIAALSVLSRSLATSQNPTVMDVASAVRGAYLTVTQDREPFDVALRGTVRDTARAQRTRSHFSVPHNPLYIDQEESHNG